MKTEFHFFSRAGRCRWVCAIGLLFAAAAHAQTPAQPPQFTPSGGVSASAFDVTVTCVTPGAQIFYRLEEPNATDVRDPDQSDTPLPTTGTVKISRPVTLKARAFAAGFEPSAVQSASYQVNGWIAVGSTHTLGLKTDQTLWAWGAQGAGRLGNGSASTTLDIPAPTAVLKAASFGGGALTGIIDASASATHSIAADGNGFVWGFGENALHQLGVGTTATGSTVDSAYAVKAQTGIGTYLTGIDHVTAGTNFSLARGTNGKVWAWGSQVTGRTGTGFSSGYAVYATPVIVDASINAAKPDLGNIAALATGVAFTLAAEPKTADGTGKLWSWGLNSDGQLGDGTVTQRLAAVWVRKTAAGPQFDNVIAIAAGDLHAAAVVKSATEDGTVWCWGAQVNGRLGNGLATALDIKSPVRVNLPSGNPLTGVVAVACGGKHTLALDNQGRVWSWGYNASSQLGRTPVTGTSPAERPALVTMITAGVRILEIAAGGDCGFAIADNGRVFSWGLNTDSQLGKNGDAASLVVRTPDPLISGQSQDFIIIEDLDDPDHDGLKNWEERALGTGLLDRDSDDDGLTDGDEVHLYHTNPLNPDSDTDGLGDEYEINNGLDPLRNDAAEDPDGDGRSNLTEMQMGSNPWDYYNSVPPILIITGNNQQALRQTWLPVPLVVEVQRPGSGGAPGVPQPNAPVKFSNAGGGLFSAAADGSNAADILEVRTGSDGRATVYFRLPDQSGKVAEPKVSAASYTSSTFHEETLAQLTAPTIRLLGGVDGLVEITQDGNSSFVDVVPASSTNRVVRYTFELRDPTPLDPEVPVSGLLSLPQGVATGIRARAWCASYEDSPVTVRGPIPAFDPPASDAPGSLPAEELVGQTLGITISGGTLYSWSFGSFQVYRSGTPAPTSRSPLAGLYFPMPGVGASSGAPQMVGDLPRMPGGQGLNQPPVIGPRTPFTCFVVGGGNYFHVDLAGTCLDLGGAAGTTFPNFPGNTSSQRHPGTANDRLIVELSFDGLHLLAGCNGVWESSMQRPPIPAIPITSPQRTVGNLRLSGSNGWIEKVVIYNRTLTPAERRAVLSFLDADITDTDHDGLPDWREAELHTNPNLADTDGDGLSDKVETSVYFTNPLLADTDGDYVTDAQELSLGTNPNDAASNGNGDIDGDGTADRIEQIAGTDPRNPASKPTTETHAMVHVAVGDRDLHDDVWSIDFQQITAEGTVGPSRLVTSNDDPTALAEIEIPVLLGTRFQFTLRRKPANQLLGTDEYQVSFRLADTAPSNVFFLASLSSENSPLTGSLAYGSGGTPPDTSGLKWGFSLPHLELLDGSGTAIARGSAGKEKFPQYHIPFEPNTLSGSESCAYILRDDKLDVTYMAGPLADVKLLLVVREDGGNGPVVYEKEIPASTEHKMATWPLTRTDGSSIEVSDGQPYSFSKKFGLKIEIRNDDAVIGETGVLPVYVDDHLQRNQQFIATKGTYPDSPLAEITWTAVLHAASKAVVQTVEQNVISKVPSGEFKLDNAFAIHRGNRIIIGGVLGQIDHAGSPWEEAVTYSKSQENAALASAAVTLSPFNGFVTVANAINNGWIAFESVENRLRADGYIEFGIMSDQDAEVLKREITAAANDPSLNEGYANFFPKAARNAIQKALVKLVSKSRLNKNFAASKEMAGGG